MRNLILPYFSVLTDVKLLQLPLVMVQSIDLRGCGFLTSSMLEKFATDLPLLQELNCASMPHLIKIGNFSQQQPQPLKFHSLQSFNLEKCTNLEELLLDAPQLTWLSVYQCPKIAPSVFEVAIRNNNLKTFLFDVELLDRSMPDIIYYLVTSASLTTLHLRYNPDIGDHEALVLASSTTLTELEFSDTSITNVGIYALAASSTLTKLHLLGSNISDDGLFALANNTTLTHLEVSFSETNSDAAVLALASNTTLEFLTLDTTKISDKGILALATNTTLQFLYLPCGSISNEDAKTFASNTTLKGLFLPGNKGIADEGAIHLSLNTTLHYLNLSNCSILDEGALALASNSTLRELNLSKTSITEKGIMGFAFTTTLQSLFVWFIPISYSTLEAFERVNSVTTIHFSN